MWALELIGAIFAAAALLASGAQLRADEGGADEPALQAAPPLVYAGTAARTNVTSPLIPDDCDPGGFLPTVMRVLGLDPDALDLGALLGGGEDAAAATKGAAAPAAPASAAAVSAVDAAHEALVARLAPSAPARELLQALTASAQSALRSVKSLSARDVATLQALAAGGGGAAELRQTLAAAAAAAAADGDSGRRRRRRALADGEAGDEGGSEGDGSEGDGSEGGLDLTAALSSVAPALLHLMSPFFGVFVTGLVGEGEGTHVPFNPFAIEISTASGGIMTTGLRLFDAYAKGVEAGAKADPGDFSYERNARAGLGLTAAFLGCKDEVDFDAAACDRAPTAMFDRDQCEKADGSTVDMKTVVADLDWFEEKRVVENGASGAGGAGGSSEESEETAPALMPRALAWDEISADEKFLHFLLFRSTTVASTYTATEYPCGMNDLKPSQPLLPGWDLAGVFTYYQPGSLEMASRPRKSLPLALALRPTAPTDANQCDVVAIIRGTGDAYEWMCNVDIANVPILGNPSMRVHRGMYRIVRAIFADWVGFLNDVDEATPACGGKLRVMVAGHSLGGGASALLGLMSKIARPDDNVQVAAFAPLSIFDDGATEFYRQHVNSRSLVMDRDPVPSSPVTTDFSAYGMPRYGFGDTDDGRPLVYRLHPGQITFDLLKEVGGEDMLNLSDKFGDFNVKIQMSPMAIQADITITVPAAIEMGAAHVCSYACFFSRDSCVRDVDSAWMCKSCPGRIGPIVIPTINIEL